MPTLTQDPLQKAKPLFIGLQSYSEAQSEFFFGRDDEIDRLTNLIKANTLTIIFGKSGTGKTSLLNAGVFPRLRKDYCLPFRIRLEFQDDSPDLVTQIKNTLKTEIDKYGFKVEAYPGDETLWEYFHRGQLWRSVTPILIFDQFEEIFTLGKKSLRFGNKDLADFWEELANLIENSIPESIKERLLDEKDIGLNYKVQKVKTLFSFREEYLPEFESITSQIPSIKYSRFRLLPMNGNQAYDVITKTWKKNINAAEAHKIVGFFASEEDKDLDYELMEIEPSLLSQVCSFIDKERLLQNREDITTEFLNKYPKEIILSSIYNEVLTESNQAVILNTISSNGSQESAKPVNEFLEDKLITDEGYRTKYALSELDKSIRPGIEILKTKYFVRDDGKSVELTHDVLTPIIKRDREERRKGLAMAIARKKANRRAFAIVMAALVAAFLIWFFTARESIQARDNAIKQKKTIEDSIRTASTSLAILGKQIDSTKASLEDLKKNNKLPLNSKDTTALSDSAYADLERKYQQEGIILDSLNKEHQKLANNKTELEKIITTKTKELDDYTIYRRKSDSAGIDSRRHIANLQNKYSRDSARLANTQKNYNDLVAQYNNYIVQVSKPLVIEDTVNDVSADTNSLHVKLFYNPTEKGLNNSPKNLRVYLVPDNTSNKNIIRKAKTYEMYCDELNLDKAAGRKIARYKNGVYKFYDVPPGKYFVKICAYYGGFYSLTKTFNGNKLVEWDASPPIR